MDSNSLWAIPVEPDFLGTGNAVGFDWNNPDRDRSREFLPALRAVQNLDAQGRTKIRIGLFKRVRSQQKVSSKRRRHRTQDLSF